MKITVLIENTTAPTGMRLKPQHGLSLYIETQGKRLLFDTGSNDRFSHNAEALGIDLSRVDFCFLSHAHSDHGGGLRYFLAINRHAPVVMKREAQQACYARFLPFFYKNIGIDPGLFIHYLDRIIFFDDRLEIIPGIVCLSTSTHEDRKPVGNNKLFVKKAGSYLLDDFAHEMTLVVSEGEQSVIFTGCSHNGIVNMLASVYKLMPGIKIGAVIGGLHFMNPLTKKMEESREVVASIGAKLKNLPVDRYYTGHCTGPHSFSILRGILGGRIAEFKTGMVLDL